MTKVHVYLNFNGNCEEAFQFYGSLFKTSPKEIHRYDVVPSEFNTPPLSEKDKNKILHISIPINENTLLMGADVIEGFGEKLSFGNNHYIMLDVESIEEAQTYFDALAKDAQKLEMDLDETFFAERFAALRDKYGVYWMIHYEGNKKMNQQGKA